MSKAKHTAAPWHVQLPTGNGLAYINDSTVRQNAPFDEQGNICVCYGSDRCQANARLIAASPEMYEMLKELIDNSKHFTDETGLSEDFYQLFSKANNLIKKIEG